MKKTFTTLSAFLSLATISSAALTAVFEYEFDASYDASSTVVTDLSGAGNHATMTGENGGANIALSTDIPAGATQGSHSIDYFTTYGVIATNNTQLLNNADVISNGGFTMTAYFQGFSPNVRKVIDYAGTEYIAIRNDGVDGARVGIGISNSVVLTLSTGDGLDANGWNHITYSFTVTDGSIPNAVLGDIRVDLNGTVTTLTGQTLDGFGDSLNRAISVGRHPAISTDHFRGQIYAPAVYLGVDPVPEPSSTALLGLGGLALLLRRRRWNADLIF
ncbi:MAG: PEP-CTERM sorting domain-containing protein [Akkermansiaceae bacterium]